METEAQPTPAVKTDDLDQETASTGSLPADQAIVTREVGSRAATSPETTDALAGQSATARLPSAADPALPDPPTMIPLPDPPRGESPRPASIPFLVVVTVISLAADLVSKYFAMSRLSGFDTKSHALHRVEIWKGHLDFIFAQNPGGAWSFLRSLPDTLRRPFFLVVSAAAIVFIISIYRRIGDDQRAMKWGLPLALGGAMGNLVDRMRYGWVIDFIDVYISRGGREHHWPTFNVADIAIVVGVGLMAIDMLWIGGKKPRSPDLQPHVSSL